MSNIQLKCIIVISNNVHHAYKFLCDFIQQNTRSALSQKLWKNCDNSTLSNLCSQKLYQYHLAKYVYCMQNFARFEAVESETELSSEFWEKRNSSVSYWAMYTQISPLLFLYIHFCAISFSRDRDQHIPKISDKVKQ